MSRDAKMAEIAFLKDRVQGLADQDPGTARWQLEQPLCFVILWHCAVLG